MEACQAIGNEIARSRCYSSVAGVPPYLVRCTRGFTPAQCDQLYGYASRLVHHKDGLCRALGGNASRRLNNDKYIYVGVDTEIRPGYASSTAQISPSDRERIKAGTLPVDMGRVFVFAGGMPLMGTEMAHEEYHYYNPDAMEPEVKGVANSCGYQ